jgi:hypothetical protein
VRRVITEVDQSTGAPVVLLDTGVHLDDVITL